MRAYVLAGESECDIGAAEWLHANAARFECFDVLGPKVRLGRYVGVSHRLCDVRVVFDNLICILQVIPVGSFGECKHTSCDLPLVISTVR
jgi:hypothetical protein